MAGDKGYDTKEFVAECRNLNATPHVAQNRNRRGGSAIDGRTVRHTGYRISQLKRKRIEGSFGWLKTIALVPVALYGIANGLSSYVLDVPNSSTANGTLIQQWSFNGYRQQQWQFVPAGGEYYSIMNRNSGKVLDVTGGSTNGGTLIQQWDYLSGGNQQWQVTSVDEKTYKIVNRQSGYALDDRNYGAPSSSGCRMNLRSSNGSLWK